MWSILILSGYESLLILIEDGERKKKKRYLRFDDNIFTIWNLLYCEKLRSDIKIINLHNKSIERGRYYYNSSSISSHTTKYYFFIPSITATFSQDGCKICCKNQHWVLNFQAGKLQE